MFWLPVVNYNEDTEKNGEKKSAFVYLANLLMNHIFLRFSNEGMVISKEINDITIIFKDY